MQPYKPKPLLELATSRRLIIHLPQLLLFLCQKGQTCFPQTLALSKVQHLRYLLRQPTKVHVRLNHYSVYIHGKRLEYTLCPLPISNFVLETLCSFQNHALWGFVLLRAFLRKLLDLCTFDISTFRVVYFRQVKNESR